jgi:hypothetical protein
LRHESFLIEREAAELEAYADAAENAVDNELSRGEEYSTLLKSFT